MQQQAFTGHGLNTRRSAKGRKQFVTQALHRDLRFVSKNGKKKNKKRWGGEYLLCDTQGVTRGSQSFCRVVRTMAASQTWELTLKETKEVPLLGELENGSVQVRTRSAYAIL